MATHFAAKGEVVTGSWRDEISNIYSAGAALRRNAPAPCVIRMVNYLARPQNVHSSKCRHAQGAAQNCRRLKSVSSANKIMKNAATVTGANA
jgi:hypothetical protein